MTLEEVRTLKRDLLIEKHSLGAISTTTTAVPSWVWTAGSYAGAWGGGAGIGYIVGRSKRAALTGGLASSGVWSVAAGVRDARVVHPAVTAGFLGLGALSLYLAWKR